MNSTEELAKQVRRALADKTISIQEAAQLYYEHAKKMEQRALRSESKLTAIHTAVEMVLTSRAVPTRLRPGLAAIAKEATL